VSICIGRDAIGYGFSPEKLEIDSNASKFALLPETAGCLLKCFRLLVRPLPEDPMGKKWRQRKRVWHLDHKKWERIAAAVADLVAPE
jgi:hypothetical protein